MAIAVKSEKITSAHGIDTYLHLDGTRLIIENRFDAQPILEANKITSADGTGGWSPSRNMRKIASVPYTLLAEWAAEGITIQSDRKEFLRRLSDPDLRGFRTDGGRRLI